VTRKSILVVTRNFPPLTGGMERLMHHSVRMLATRFDVTFIGPDGCGRFAPENVSVIECTPTVAFPVGGVVDAVADGVNGLLVPEGDYEAFAYAVLSICQGGPPSRTSCRAHAEKFSWKAHERNLLAALDLAVGPTWQ